MNDAADVSRRDAWLMAARPHTLPAAAAPVIVGTGLAVGDGVFAPLPALAALVGAALIQVGTNFANDYFDAAKGADTNDRQGFTRVTQSGLLAPTTIRRATIGTFGLAILVGVYLVAVGGLPILFVGLASIAAGVLYTGGPYPFGYYALGDLFVFVFFGLVAVVGTYYVQATALVAGPVPLAPPPDTIPLAAVVAALPMAAITTAILVVNNLRDRETDRAAGKITLAVVLGKTGTRVEYVGLLGLAYTVPIWFWLQSETGPAVLLPLLTLPYALIVSRTVLRETGPVLNEALTRTGRLLFGYALLFAVGLAV